MNHDGKMSREQRMLVKMLSLSVRAARAERASVAEAGWMDDPNCPECGALMEYEPALEAYACNNHVE